MHSALLWLYIVLGTRMECTGFSKLKLVKVQEPPTSKVLLDTPRTHKAFVRSGIPKKELSVKTLQDFHIPGDLAETQKLRFHHYEARRQDKVNMVIRAVFMTIGRVEVVGGYQQTLNGSFSAISKPIFVT